MDRLPAGAGSVFAWRAAAFSPRGFSGMEGHFAPRNPLHEIEGCCSGKIEYIRQMRVEMDRIAGQIADAVNAAADGNAINGSKMQVRDLMMELRKTAFEKAVQMRVNSTESVPPGVRRGSPSRARGSRAAAR